MSEIMEQGDILAKICTDTRAELARRMAVTSLDEIKHLAREGEKPRGFGRALMDASAAGRAGLITEIKKASPSGGVIREDFDPAQLARAYAEGGAACLSVLTDKVYFQGSPEHLKAARSAVKLPVLRKDFILDPWQVYESRAMGADCILLIMAALEDTQARELEDLARALDMDVLVEVHNEAELERALGLQTPLLYAVVR
jgi:indole-3-glycerol phosphate synthase